jgi:hypothetical protein
MISKSKKSVTKIALFEQTNSEEEKQLMISEAAYYRAENRGFAPDHELEDWLEAEKQVQEISQAA